MKAGLVTSAALQRLCGVCRQIGQDTAADDSLWCRERAALRPNVAGTTPTEAEVEDRPAGVAKCGCARHVGALAQVRLVMRDAWLARVSQPWIVIQDNVRRRKCARSVRGRHAQVGACILSLCLHQLVYAA